MTVAAAERGKSTGGEKWKREQTVYFFLAFFFKFYYLQRRRANSGDFQGIFGQLTNKSLDKKIILFMILEFF
jgi:hypothetical protein